MLTELPNKTNLSSSSVLFRSSNMGCFTKPCTTITENNEMFDQRTTEAFYSYFKEKILGEFRHDLHECFEYKAINLLKRTLNEHYLNPLILLGQRIYG